MIAVWNCTGRDVGLLVRDDKPGEIVIVLYPAEDAKGINLLQNNKGREISLVIRLKGR